MFWIHPLIVRASFLFALNIHLAQYPISNTTSLRKKRQKNLSKKVVERLRSGWIPPQSVGAIHSEKSVGQAVAGRSSISATAGNKQ